MQLKNYLSKYGTSKTESINTKLSKETMRINCEKICGNNWGYVKEKIEIFVHNKDLLLEIVRVK